MNKLVTMLSATVLAMFVSCEKEELVIGKVNDTHTINRLPQSNARSLTANHVRVFANTVLPQDILDESDTLDVNHKKSATYIIPDVSYIFSSNGDTLIYIVNYGEENGFALLSADSEEYPLIAFATQGVFYYDSLATESPLKNVIDRKLLAIADSIIQPLDTLSEVYNRWQKTIDNGDGRIVAGISDVEGGNKSLSRILNPVARPRIADVYFWDQGIGYNYYAPQVIVNGIYQKALIGCPAVAVGMLCLRYNRPFNRWPYNSMPSSLNKDQPTSLAKMLYDIACTIPNYVFGAKNTDKSGASDDDILVGLKNLGYTKAKFGSFDFETAIENLIEAKPILLSGNRKTGGGHVWYCEGYAETKNKSYTFMNFGKGNNAKEPNAWYDLKDWEFYQKWNDSGDNLQYMFVNLTYTK